MSRGRPMTVTSLHTSASVVAGLSLALLVGLLALLGGPMAGPARSQGGACPDQTGVTVVVDFQSLGGGTVIGCAPGPVGSGFDALQQAGFGYTTVTTQPGFVCRIDGRPADRGCADTPPADAFWSYWHADRGGDWAYSTSGAGSRTPAPGSVEGWSYNVDPAGPDRTPPRTAPPARAAAPEPTPGPDPTPTSAPPAPPAAATPAPATGGDGQGGGQDGDGNGQGTADGQASTDPQGTPALAPAAATERPVPTAAPASAAPAEEASATPTATPTRTATPAPTTTPTPTETTTTAPTGPPDDELAEAEPTEADPTGPPTTPPATSTPSGLAVDEGSPVGTVVGASVLVAVLGAAGVVVVRRREP